MNDVVIASAARQSMTSGLHSRLRYARSDEQPFQGPCVVSGQIRRARNDVYLENYLVPQHRSMPTLVSLLSTPVTALLAINVTPVST